MKIITSLFLLLFALITVACASGVKRGSIAMKVSDSQAHVGLGAKEVNVGDHLVLYHNECSGGGAGKDRVEKVCKKVETGHGVVAQLLGNDYSVVNFGTGIKFAEGDILEKHPH